MRSTTLQIASVISLLLVSLLIVDSAYGQRRRRNPILKCKEGVKSDWRFPELATDNFTQPIDVGDGFEASRNCNSVDVTIPGAYSDSLMGSRANPLSLQLAAAVFVRVCNTKANDTAEAMDKFFWKAEKVRQGSGDIMTEYSFRLQNGRTAHIFTYYNDLSGLIGIVKTNPAK